MKANMASTLDAKHENDRKLIIDLYKESINSLKQIPSEDQFYKIAQTKIEEYQRKKENALKNKVVKNSIVQSKPKVIVSKAPPEEHQLNMQQKLTNFLKDTLDTIVNKNHSFELYWCDQTKDLASTLFNPFRYEILDLMAYPPPYNDKQMVGSARVRIQSTNRGSQAIINVWRITLGREKRNTDIRKKGDYCIVNLYDGSP